MFVAGNFLDAVARILDIALTAYYWIIIVRAIVSWVNPDPWNPIVQFLQRATEPVLAPIRRIVPMTGPVDFSPMILMVLIILAARILTGIILSL